MNGALSSDTVVVGINEKLVVRRTTSQKTDKRRRQTNIGPLFRRTQNPAIYIVLSFCKAVFVTINCLINPTEIRVTGQKVNVTKRVADNQYRYLVE